MPGRRRRVTAELAAEVERLVAGDGLSLWAAVESLDDPKPSYSAFSRALPHLVRLRVPDEAKWQIADLDEASRLLGRATRLLDRHSDPGSGVPSIDLAARCAARAAAFADDAAASVRLDHGVPGDVTWRRRVTSRPS